MRNIYLLMSEIRHLLNRGLLHFTFLLLALIGMQVSLQAGDIDPTKHGTGAIPLSQEQLDELHQNSPRILAVKPNKIGAARINEHNQKLGAGPLSIEYATTPDEEFITNKNSEGVSHDELMASWGISSLPAHVDNSQLPCFPPIGDQGQHGSCVAFATTYYHATHEYGLLNGVNNKTSSNGIRSPKWTYNMINWGGDGGSWPTSGYDLLNKNGATSIVNFPYDGNYTQWDLNTQDWLGALNYRMAPVQFLNVNSSTDINTIKSLLNNGHAVTFTTYAYSWVITRVGTDPSTTNNPYAGQYAISWMNGNSGGHHVTLIGYDDNVWIDVNGNGKVDAGEKGAFLMANSWGTGWANQGFMWISYDAFYNVSQVVNGPGPGRLQVADQLYSMVPLAANYQPKIAATFSLTQSVRDEIAMSVGSSATTATTPSTTIASQALQQSGGSLAFDGTAAKSMTATFALDLTDLLPSTSTTERYYLITSDVSAGNPTTENTFTLVDLVNNKQISMTPNPNTVDNGTIRPYIDYLFSNNNNPITVNITSPTNGATISGNIQVTANATGTNLGGVIFYIDSIMAANDTAAPYVMAVDTTTLTNGEHSFKAIAYDNAIKPVSESVVKVTVQNNASSLYINCGGNQVPDICNKSLIWQADLYSTGSIGTYTNNNLPSFMGIYATERYGNDFTYNLPISNGNHTVTLQMAEIYYSAKGQRVMNVKINGTQVLTNLDLYALGGFANPQSFSFPVNVTNNSISIEFISVTGGAKVSGISVK